ncbi:Ubiquitin-60S ribosomal protein L40 [Mizuhopecten yessoensis]|uniref:Ubiquitin-60S ribosomal protein L40 n=2 Tax=Mizuhopecten yessoensis TaxID=6573 RepID=A0A210PSV3_MIZYE|nr:Ubiquitin-60S ribosomal protein L40 [Mizuhopecten yessoensis]
MADMIQLFVTSGSNKKTTFQIHKDASVEDLMRKISDWNGIDSASQRVLFAAKELVMNKDGKKMYLSDYKLQDRSQLFVVFQLPGGSDPDPLEGQVRQPKQFEDAVKLTDLSDMITWDDDPNNQRAKMPCGHAIG